MKTKNLFLLQGLIASLGLVPASRVLAQTFTTLHSFTARSGGSYGTNGDGALPYARLVLANNTLYGTALEGGIAGNGTLYKVNADGTGFTSVYSFTALSSSSPAGSGPYTNSDGVGPSTPLILSGNTLYGTAHVGGSAGKGTVFKVNSDGTGFTTLHSFTAIAVSPPDINSDGAWPIGALILSGNTLYGTAYRGGSSGYGTVFAVNTDGTSFTTLHSFTAVSGPTPGSGSTNGDGALPSAGLILSGSTLYGTATFGGSSGNGTVFAVNTDGTGFTNLHSFTYVSDGAVPNGLILSSNTMYGTAFAGGSSGKGTVFKVNTDGTGFTTLHSFTGGSDGANPDAGLIISGNNLYGTAYDGGIAGNGTVFAVNTDGSSVTTLHRFTEGNDGANPEAGLILSGNTLYGTATSGGSSGNGTVFSISLESLRALQLTITSSSTNVILSWPTNYAEVVIQEDHYEAYFLQYATNLVSPVVWTFIYPMPVVSNGQLVVTNTIDGTQRFYRILKVTGPLSDVPCLWAGPNPCPCRFHCVVPTGGTFGVWSSFANCRDCPGIF